MKMIDFSINGVSSFSLTKRILKIIIGKPKGLHSKGIWSIKLQLYGKGRKDEWE